MCPVPIAPIFSLDLDAREVFVTGLRLLIFGVGVGYDPVGITDGFQVDPPLKISKR